MIDGFYLYLRLFVALPIDVVLKFAFLKDHKLFGKWGGVINKQLCSRMTLLVILK